MKKMRFSRDYKNSDTVVSVKDIKIGLDNFVMIAGPCAIESEEQYYETSKAVIESGASIIRGSVFKPRTSPYDFQGLEHSGLKLLSNVREDFNIPVETEVVDPRDVKTVANHVDILRVGTRNMQNFSLLKELSKIDIPIILKRGMSATINEWLFAAEYLMVNGNDDVILCERGIRTYIKETRNTLDLSAIPILKKKTHLPIIIDPSHATGNRNLIIPMSKAAIAVGADGLIVEVHYDPPNALCDGHQSLTPEMFSNLMKFLKPYLHLEGRSFSKKGISLMNIREEISELDSYIIDILGERFKLIPELIAYKQQNNIPVFQPEREKQMHKKYWNLALKNKVNPELIQSIYENIIHESRELQTQGIDHS